MPEMVWSGRRRAERDLAVVVMMSMRTGRTGGLTAGGRRLVVAVAVGGSSSLPLSVIVLKMAI